MSHLLVKVNLNDIEFLKNLKKQVLPYEAAVFEAQKLGINIKLPEVQAILKIIYQLED